MATEKFKISYTVSMSRPLDNGMTQNLGSKMYQRVTIFGKFGQDMKIIPFNSLSFADGTSSVTAEKEGAIYTVTLQNKDLIIEAETVGGNAGPDINASLSDIFHCLPTVYDENGNVVDPDTEFVTAVGTSVTYISIPNMVSDSHIS